MTPIERAAKSIANINEEPRYWEAYISDAEAALSAICEKLKSVRGALPVIQHHHERMDGSGYPDHLCGQDIPLAARVMTILISMTR